ncbi:MAG: energy-coupling factor transporter ATPase [Clostridia bacterium]|nr:energy-coupling factor transporter ATPase [Clostridia bacterium]
MRIQAEHLSYTYNAKSPFAVAALKDVSLTIEEGDFFGVIGRTGSGKSTFVQHLNGLLRLPSSLKRRYKQKVKRGQTPPPLPQLKVGEFDLADRKTNFRALRAKVGMVFQYPEYQLFAETVAGDVAFGYKNFSEKKPTDEEVQTAVRAALEVVGLNYEELKDKSPFDLSGGQKRRVAIAGVIVSRPEVLVLDEPAAGLDPAGKREIMELLHKLHEEWCKTIVVVSHDMDEIAENCNRVAVFSEGEVKYVLPPSELFEKSEELISLGLDVPLAAKLTFALRERGIEVKNDFTVEGFINSVLSYAKNEGESE